MPKGRFSQNWSKVSRSCLTRNLANHILYVIFGGNPTPVSFVTGPQWAGRVLVKIQSASIVTHTRWFLGSFLIWKWVSPKSDTWLIKKYHILKIYYTLFHGLVKMGNPKVIVWKLLSLPDPCASWKSLKNRWERLIKVIFWSFGRICRITLLQKKF